MQERLILQPMKRIRGHGCEMPNEPVVLDHMKVQPLLWLTVLLVIEHPLHFCDGTFRQFELKGRRV